MSPKPVHPGKVLADQLAAIGVTPTELARQIAVPPNRISQIIRGKRAISGDTALRLAHWLGGMPEQWLKLQSNFDIDVARNRVGHKVSRLPKRGFATKAVPARGASD